MTAIFFGGWRLKLMIVRPRDQPSFVRDARSIGAKGVVIADVIHNSSLLTNFLPQDVAENAALAFAVPFAGGAQFVQNAARDKSGCGDLRMRMRPFLSGLRPFIPEDGHVFEAGVAFQIGDAKCIGFED